MTIKNDMLKFQSRSKAAIKPFSDYWIKRKKRKNKVNEGERQEEEKRKNSFHFCIL